ncbi:hypothetical protein HK405_001261, partial [Cladochytrium tenue]
LLSFCLLGATALLASAAPTPGGSATATGTGLDTAANVAKYKTATKLQLLSACPAYTVAAWNCTICSDADLLGVHSISTFSDASTDSLFGYAAVDDLYQTVLVTFRGSHNVLNWLSVVLFDQTILPNATLSGVPSGVLVHNGFLLDYLGVRNSVRSLTKTLLTAYPSYTLTLNGHSLGGALALLAAVDLINLGTVTASRVHVQTAGQPRVGNQAWSNYIADLGLASYIRVVNRKDIVPHLPYEWLGYRHIPGERWIDLANDVVLCNDVGNGGEDTDCMNTVGSSAIYEDHTNDFNILNMTIC